MYHLLSSFTEDIIESERGEKRAIGGPALYGGYTLYLLRGDFKIHTSLDSYIRSRVAEEYPYIFERIDLASPCDRRFIFKHIYRGEKRRSYLMSEGCSISIITRAIPENSVLIVSPVYREFSLEEIKKILSREIRIAIDLQGFVRIRREDGSVENNLTTDLLKDLENVDVIHASYEEVENLSRDPLESLEIISRITKSRIVILSMGGRGFLAKIRGEGVYFVEAYMRGVKGDETGCGDILLASTVYTLYNDYGYMRSFKIASVVSGLRVLKGFPMNIDLSDIEREESRIGIRKIR
ncbi:MAG: PfkB family carbohydrate kinase [Sulfolobales archaeon]